MTAGCAGCCVCLPPPVDAPALRWPLPFSDGAQPRWRLVFALVGLPDPLPAGEWRLLLDAFQRRYGTAETVQGLRLAAAQPPTWGWGEPQRRRAATLAHHLQGLGQDPPSAKSPRRRRVTGRCGGRR